MARESTELKTKIQCGDLGSKVNIDGIREILWNLYDAIVSISQIDEQNE